MRVIFMGSAELSCPALGALAKAPGIDVEAVVVQPDRPAGRGRKILSCPACDTARELGLRVFMPENVNNADSVAELKKYQPDLIVIIAYGQILKPAILQMPALGCVNLHASLLPKYRGAAPIQWAIARGETITGVTSMYINEKMDAGDIILQKEMPIRNDDTAGRLHTRLAELGAGLLLETVDLMMKGEVLRTPQIESDATYAPKLKKEDGRIDWDMKAVDIFNRVRGFHPWPGCWVSVTDGSDRADVLKVLKVSVENADSGAVGEVIDAGGAGPLVRVSDGAVRLLEVQPAGGKVMSGRAYMCGHVLKAGDCL